MKQNSILAALLSVGFVSTSALAADLPVRKAGLWEVSIANEGMPEKVTLKQCTDEATDRLMMESGKETATKMGGSCAKYETKKDGSGYVAEAECTFANTKMVSKTIFSGDFQTDYKAVTDASYDPPMMGMKQAKTTMTGKYLGACDADQVPGDVVMPGGVKMNIKELGMMKK